MLFTFCRQIGNQVHYSISLLYYLTLNSVFAPLLCLLETETPVRALPSYDWTLYYFVAAIVCIFFVHLCLVRASQTYSPVATTTVLLHLGIPCSYALEWLVGTPGWTNEEVAGASVIFVTNVVIVLLRVQNYV